MQKIENIIENLIKIHRKLLKEGVYGDHLFGDKDSGVKIKWYDKELEKDTTAEKELFNKLKSYADSEYETYSNMNIDGLLPLFQKLKKEYPNVVNPDLNKDQYIYRGTVTEVEHLEQLRQDPHATEDKRNIIIPNQEYSSKRKISSWSINYFNAASFAIASADKKGMVPLVVRAKAVDADLYFNPDFMNKLSTQPEEEVLNATNPIKVDIMIIKGFDTEFGSDEDLNELFSKEWWKEVLQLDEGKTVLTPQIILQGLKQSQKEIGYPEHLNISPEDINDGYCDSIAQAAVDNIPGAVFESIDDYPEEWKNYYFPSTNGHSWFKYKNKYYDAECPEGVNDWRDLPLMKRCKV